MTASYIRYIVSYQSRKSLRGYLIDTNGRLGGSEIGITQLRPIHYVQKDQDTRVESEITLPQNRTSQLLQVDAH